MNIMRKLLVGGNGQNRNNSSSNAGVSEDPHVQAQHTALGLMHLRKLFMELVHTTNTSLQSLTLTENQDKLYKMLPLFCKIFGNSSAKDIMEKFEDIQLFCQMVSRLMVSEIRRLASNKSPEEASFEIVKFLEIDCTEENSNGWMLLSTVNLLASADKTLVQVMTDASLPSTLVKCLYLFFDLPDLENPVADVAEGGSEFTPRERRILLQKIFVQVLVRLCSHTSPAEELARADDLSLLFRAITSWCPPHNVPWRKSASEVLMTLSRHGMTEPVVSYIHNTSCVSMCVQNMQRLQELSPLDIVEMFVTVFCFLKDSSLVRQTLLDDFRACQGYIFISEFLLRLEQDGSQEAVDALRNLLLLISTLSMCGYIELKPSQASIASLYQISGFQLPQPLGQGVSVRNVQAFQVLQSVFLKANSSNLCCVILDAISSIYHSDPANYFILESQHTLSQFAEKIYAKSVEVQGKFFKILEYVVFGLNFVPCKELISLSILLKSQSSIKCSIACMETLINILRYDSTFKDVYREVGLLEVMVTCLHRYAALLKESQGDGDVNSEEVEPDSKIVEDSVVVSEDCQTLGQLIMEALTFLLSGNAKNCSVFRESGGARCAHNMVPCLTCRTEALGIVQQLVLCNGGDDDMGTLLGMMHTAPITALDLKTCILKSLLFVLKESHRTRTVFRKVGGFVYVMSVLVSMEGCLAGPPKSPWDVTDRKKVLQLLKTVFTTLTIAMRYEPANAKFFANEICFTTLTDTIRLLGCFSKCSSLGPSVVSCEPMQQSMFHTLFTASKEILIQKDDIPRILISTTLMLRLLYDMALDNYDKPALTESSTDSPRRHGFPDSVKHSKSPSRDKKSSSSPTNKRAHVSLLNLNPSAPEPVIVHPAVVVAILKLLPGIEHDMGLTLQCYTSEMLKSLVRSERNQQVMCEAGMPSELLASCHLALEDESHPLHPPIQYMFERLAAQTLLPKDLRCFLRLGNPLCCKPISSSICSISDDVICITQPANQLKQGGGAVPLTRVKTLVSMTTPRDFRHHGTSITPPFVEFDMSAEGFGCLYLPSIAPQSVSNGPSVVGAGLVGGAETSVVGGIGTGDRIFPPQTGLTYSTWFCVDRFSDPRSDPHAVRLLMLIRNVQGKEQEHLVCFTVLLSSRDKALLVSTQEYPLPQSGGTSDWEPEIQQDLCIRIWSPDLIQEGQWHHLVLILNRAVLKNSSYSLFVDGQHISTKKMHYISQNPGGGAANLTVASSVYGYIGTPPSSRRHSRLVWKQGVSLLVEEILSTQTISVLYTLGPNYLGSLQAPVLCGNESSGCIAEEKVMFGLNAMATSLLTLAKIRKVYSKVDSRSIAKLLGMSSHDNASPICVMHNSAGHLTGPARSLGGILIGYLGVRSFCPRPVACMLETVGGTAALLGLIAMASNVEGLYAAVKALVCVARSNWSAQVEMDRTKGYQTLAMLLKKKKSLLNSHILHLTFSLVGTIDSGRESSYIPNTTAFGDLLCDIEIWRDAPLDLQRSLYEHFVELVTESAEQKNNLRVIREKGMVVKLLNVLSDPQLSNQTSHVICHLLTALLQNTPISSDILSFGQFVASTLPAISMSEKHLKLDDITDSRLEDSPEINAVVSPRNITLRNGCLKILHSLLYTSGGHVNHVFCENVVQVLGFDWFLLFIHGHLHSSTVISALQILVIILTNQNLISKFREASQNGGWLHETEPVLKNRMGVVLGFNVGTTTNNKSVGSREIVKDACCIPGFQMLQWLVVHHLEIPHVYFLLLAMLLQQPVKTLPSDIQFDLDSIWSYIFGVPASQSASAIANKREICSDFIPVLLSMVRAMLNQSSSSTDNFSAHLKEYPVTLIQFLLFLYHNTKDFMPICMTSEILCSLASTLFPLKSTPGNSEITSPSDDFKVFSDADPIVMINRTLERQSSGILTIHPARKFVMDFLRVIVVDSLSMPVSGKNTPVIDLLLDSMPINSTRIQQCEFQTELLTSLMEHLLAADVLLGEQAALPIVGGGSYANIGTNVFYFASRVVDKLWQGEFTRDSNEIFDFVIKLIGQSRRKPEGLNIEAIYQCLDRTILYQLSRPMESVSDQMSIMEALHKLTTYRSVVFGPTNNQSEFIGCLCYCLLQLTDNQAISMDTSRKTHWHASMGSNNGSRDFPDGIVSDSKREDQMASYQEGQGLIIAAARRVWEELYYCKKTAIEDIFKVALMGSTAGCSAQLQRMLTPDLRTVRDQIQETASRIWLNFIDSETDKKPTLRQDSWQLHNQLQSKLQKVTGGLTRLAIRKPKRESSTKTIVCTATFMEFQMWTFNHLSIIKDLIDFHFKQYQQSNQHIQKYVFEEWLQTESELTRECGLWGPLEGSSLDKWTLDMTEGPSRMRKKMIKNELFYIHYPYRPDVELGDNRAIKYKVATSYDSKEFYQQYRGECLVEREKDAFIKIDSNMELSSEEIPGLQHQVSLTNDADLSLTAIEEREIGFQGLRAAGLLTKTSMNKSTDIEEDADLTPDNSLESEQGSSNHEPQDRPDNQTMLRLLEAGEKISYMFRCARIQGLDTCEGLLLFGKEHFYVVDGFTLLKTREIRDIDYLPANMHEPIIPSCTTYKTKGQKRMCSKFPYEDVREVHIRRYLLQPIALEVFSADGRNYLLAFPRNVIGNVYKRFMMMATAITDNAHQSVSGQKRNANVEPGAGLLSSLIGDTSVTQRWVRGEISNFQYLMHLNTLAGRSYNDLMQYPVFPWVLADYDSEELDLCDSSTFRDFTKPMGAQSSERLNQFMKRYKEWDDPHGETPPYHYGTHYSSAMIVASYLVRMEPFTQHFLRLQGGHFDLADRMFHSVKDSWLSASKHNMADVKELIPEFFYLPEFLNNANKFDLGCKQNGIQLNDIVLPVWAKNDPREFIRIHRQALECDYVSLHLHEWIDLIFGYKQQGQPAIDAVNMFHHLFYEGKVDIYNIDDPLKKNATIGFINNFGQIPKQLFKKPHPQKKLNGRSVLETGPIQPGLSISPDKLFFHNLDNLKPTMQPVKELRGEVGQIIYLEKSSILAVEQNKCLIPPLYTKYVAWGFADHSLRIGNYESDKATFVCESLQSSEVLCCTCPNSKVIVTGGTSTVVNVWQLGNKKQLTLRQSLYGHTEPVTCLAASPAYNLIISGSRDRKCIIWDMSRLCFVRQLTDHEGPVAAIAINELTGDIATCAGTYLHLWSINGDKVASVNTATGRTDRTQQILCVAFSQLNEWDPQNVVLTGSSDGIVRMWSTDYVQVPMVDPAEVKSTLKLGNIGANAMSSTDDPDRLSVTSPMTPEHKAQEMIRRLSLVDSIKPDSSEIGSIMRSESESSLSDEDSVSSQTKSKEVTSPNKPQVIICLDSVEEYDEKCELSSIAETNSTPTLERSQSTTSNAEGVQLRAKNRGSSSNAFHRCSTVLPSRDNLMPVGETGSLRMSRSDTSIADSFVLVNPNDVSETDHLASLRKQHIANKRMHSRLRDGFKWQCQLVFRSKLTMHTAFDRKDNIDPAAITAIAISKDHKTVYVGESKGRIFSWSVTDHPGRVMADHWMRDDGVDSCLSCGVKFTFAERRHHCRNCGQLFCSKCSKFESEISRMKILKPVRVCKKCYQSLKTSQES